ncbi:MAG TPA: LarC family nickel insertion protein, partial [Candidatus Fraserbacteria bacterium]|nr:LarC family nickel insertion protein [Candidatus Fraserbacteria bacterium]
IEQLQIERWYASKVNLGSGMVQTQHGLYPVPAPATLELLKGLPTYSSDVEAELITPTGAAILRHLRPEFRLPAARWSVSGYGAGTRELEIPNALRVLFGQPLARPIAEQEATVIETDLDDMSPELLPYLREKLFAAGAQDVSWHSLQMKKGRWGVRLYLLAAAERIDALSELLFRETTTLGLRLHRVNKRILERELISVKLPGGMVRVKLGRLGQEIVNVKPEYEDCRELAINSGLPLEQIERLARAAAEEQLQREVS